MTPLKSNKLLSITVSAVLISGITLLALFYFKNKTPKIEGMVFIPEGIATIGSTDIDKNSLGKEFGSREERLFVNEKPLHEVHLNDFHIDKFEVTNKNYKSFTDESGHEAPPNWENETFAEGRENHPINAVSWFDAYEFCKWSGKRLPTEQEWEKAARGPNNNKYPWGNEYDKKMGNLDKGDTVPVGTMVKDRSYYGVYDMGGNITEWTQSWYQPYPGSNLKSKYFGKNFKVVRGSSGNVKGHYLLTVFESRSSHREYYLPKGKGIDVGFRCAKGKSADIKF